MNIWNEYYIINVSSFNKCQICYMYDTNYNMIEYVLYLFVFVSYVGIQSKHS